MSEEVFERLAKEAGALHPHDVLLVSDWDELDRAKGNREHLARMVERVKESRPFMFDQSMDRRLRDAAHRPARRTLAPPAPREKAEAAPSGDRTPSMSALIRQRARRTAPEPSGPPPPIGPGAADAGVGGSAGIYLPDLPTRPQTTAEALRERLFGSR